MYCQAHRLVCGCAQVMCEVSKADIQDHVAERLEREHAEKERHRREKLEAHLYLQVTSPVSFDPCFQPLTFKAAPNRGFQSGAQHYLQLSLPHSFLSRVAQGNSCECQRFS